MTLNTCIKIINHIICKCRYDFHFLESRHVLNKRKTRVTISRNSVINNTQLYQYAFVLKILIFLFHVKRKTFETKGKKDDLPAIENVIMKTELKSVIAMPAWPFASRKSPNIIANDDVGPNVVIYRKNQLRVIERKMLFVQ